MLILRKTPDVTLRSIITVARSAIAPVTATYINTIANRNYTKDYASSSDDEKEPKKKSKKPKATAKPSSTEPTDADESAAARLNRLLASMQTDDYASLAKKTTDMARPGDNTRKQRESAKQAVADKDVFTAAKRVAALLGDDSSKKQTESELLAKLLGHNLNETGVDGEVTDKEASTKSKQSDLNLTDLIVGMKIDRRSQPKEETRSDYVRRMLSAKTQQQQHQNVSPTNQRPKRKRDAETFTGSVNLFGSAGLGIFKDPKQLETTTSDMLTTWSHLECHELKLQVTHPPANYFEKIARWTEHGRVWRFPIDNEQDMVEEANVDFSEHIFLEQHLESWCPNTGPIRHFMELVCVGLSKNPYITAKEKKEHILWFRDYFEAKKDLLKDLISKEKTPQSDGKHLEA